VAFEFNITVIDPACGACTIPQALTDHGFTAYGTDIIRRVALDHPLFLNEHDFLSTQLHLMDAWHPLSIIMNPPYSNQDGVLVRGLAERFIRKALAIASHKVAVLVPVKQLAGQGRAKLFAEFPPDIYILTERPSMPPGDKIAELGAKAWKRGKVDFMWLVWDRQRPREESRTFWIPPRPKIRLQPALQLAIAA
jgi:hypothetical protein